ncbi:hypothetical protein [Curtobacterium sp. MCBD17_026]|uniref:hypothetical protein n=1 Tax=Curtobacterium sp. MCBD17_026 TaxID=2175621 RepID=UPI000DA8624E|nr:hypothetical protein [Curtobacterium sp. MCBD17_026]WIB72587.1 hypothetical protein DEI85_17505 [Curtobacterium sp. MCBD17_026]
MTTNQPSGNKPSKNNWRSDTWLGAAIVLMALSIIVPGLVVVPKVDNPEQWFRGFALSAAVVSAVAALLRLLAHNNKNDIGPWMDGLGKALGFSAAFLAMIAAGALFAIDMATSA